MKKFYILLVAMMFATWANALNMYEPPIFNEDEWDYMGIGVYSGGVFDYLGTEYLEDLPAKIWKSKANDNVYWVKPDGTNKKPFDLPEGEEWLQTVDAFIIYAQNPQKVYTSPIWTMHPGIFCAYQRVPEIMGIIEGSTLYYGTMDGDYITFPQESYRILTMPDQNKTNLIGNFAVTLPPYTGINDVQVDKADAEYYNINGMKVAQPTKGELYIEKRGNKSRKIIF